MTASSSYVSEVSTHPTPPIQYFGPEAALLLLYSHLPRDRAFFRVSPAVSMRALGGRGTWTLLTRLLILAAFACLVVQYHRRLPAAPLPPPPGRAS